MGYSRLELHGKVAVVIGGSSGVCKTIAHGLAEAGADVLWLSTAAFSQSRDPVLKCTR